MPEQELNRAEVGARVQEMDRTRMPERMRCDPRGQPCPPTRLVAGLLDRASADRGVRPCPREQPVRGPVHSPPRAQHLQQRRRAHHVAILRARAVDAEDHPRAIDGADGEPGRVGDPQARGVAGRQEGAMERRRHPGETLDHFRWAEDDG